MKTRFSLFHLLLLSLESYTLRTHAFPLYTGVPHVAAAAVPVAAENKLQAKKGHPNWIFNKEESQLSTFISSQ